MAWHVLLPFFAWPTCSNTHTRSQNADGPMVAFIKENGAWVRHTGMELRLEPMGRYGMMENGFKMNLYERIRKRDSCGVCGLWRAGGTNSVGRGMYN